MSCRPKAARAGLAAVALLALTGCEWLLGLDRTPPACSIVSPTDSSTVSGTVTIRADATDSVGVSRVDFYADGGLLGTDSIETWAADWRTDSLPDESWHTLFCVAFDLAGNQGLSETLDVKVGRPDQRSIYHGTLQLATGTAEEFGFTAAAGETLAGDARTQSNGSISRFLWLDRQNHTLFKQGQPFTALVSHAGVVELSVLQPVPQTDSFYIVFENTTGFTQTYWVRFRLE
jgi:hypothetical protein